MWPYNSGNGISYIQCGRFVCLVTKFQVHFAFWIWCRVGLGFTLGNGMMKIQQPFSMIRVGSWLCYSLLNPATAARMEMEVERKISDSKDDCIRQWMFYTRVCLQQLNWMGGWMGKMQKIRQPWWYVGTFMYVKGNTRPNWAYKSNVIPAG